MQGVAALPQESPSFFCSPIDWTCEKVRELAEAIFGYLVRVLVFQMGVQQNTTGADFVISWYNRVSCDPYEPFNRERLERSKKLLTDIGGKEVTLTPADGGAEIRCMTFHAKDLISWLQAQGTTFHEIEHEGEKRAALLNAPAVLKEKFFLPTVEIEGQEHVLLPAQHQYEDKAPMIVHFHSPGRSMCMDRKVVINHLLAGCDITISDQRGTADSTGTPSEGGYYLDAEAVYQYAASQASSSDRLYISGFCEGASLAIYLKEQHPEAHLVVSNTYTSLEEVLERYGSLGSLAAKYGLHAIQSTDPAITSRVKQDGFDNLAKLQRIPQDSPGRVIIIHTDTDKMMPEETVPKFRAALNEKKVATKTVERQHPDPSKNGHMQPPLEDPKVWLQFMKLVSLIW